MMFVDDVFGNAKTRIFDVHLNQHFTFAGMVAFVSFDATVHVRRFDDLVVFIQNQTRVDTTDVFTTNDGDAGNGGTHGEVFPVFTGDFSGTQGARENRHVHGDFFVPAISCLGIDIWKTGIIRVADSAARQAFGAQRVALNV